MKSRFSREVNGSTKAEEIITTIEDFNDDIPIRTRKVTKDYKKPNNPSPLKPNPVGVSLRLVKNYSLNQEHPINYLEQNTSNNKAHQQLINIGTPDSTGVRCLINNTDDTFEELLFDLKESTNTSIRDRRTPL